MNANTTKATTTLPSFYVGQHPTEEGYYRLVFARPPFYEGVTMYVSKDKESLNALSRRLQAAIDPPSAPTAAPGGEDSK